MKNKFNYYVPIILDFKWKLIYILLSFILFFCVCLDSWEYLISFELTEILKNNPKLKTLVYTKITEGQLLIYLIALQYSILMIIPVFVLYIILFINSGLYKKESLFLLILLLLLILIIYIYFLFNHYYFFPLICQDLLQYEYHNEIFNILLELRLDSMISIVDLIKLKIKIFFIFCFNFLFFIFMFIFLKNKKNFLFLIIQNKLFFYFLFFIYLLYFFEIEFYIFIFIFLIHFFFFELFFLIRLIYKAYYRNKVR